MRSTLSIITISAMFFLAFSGVGSAADYRPIAWEEVDSQGYYSNPSYAYDNGYNDTSTYALIGVNWGFYEESIAYIWDTDSDGNSNATLYYTWEVPIADPSYGEEHIEAWNYNSGNWDLLRAVWWGEESLATRSLSIDSNYISSTGEIKIKFKVYYGVFTETEINLYDVYINTDLPVTTITSGPPDPSNSSSVTFEFESTEPGSTFECELDGSGYSACTSPMTFTGLSDGTHIFNVGATDQAGNTYHPTPASYSWTIDTTPPTITITSPESKKYTTDYVDLSFYVNESTRWAGYKLDKDPWVTVTGGSTTLTNLGNGRHKVKVSAADLAGNHGYAWVWFKVKVSRQ